MVPVETTGILEVMPVGRFAPSPTGRLHLGNLRTAVVAWLHARGDGSRFLLRFEDLDTAAVRAEHYRSQANDLAALGLDWDEPTINQSDDLDRYRQALDRLQSADLVYPCFCSRREIREAASAPNRPHAGHHYPGTCADLDTAARARRSEERPAAWRVRAEGTRVEIVDELLGPVGIELDDFVVQRNDGTPAYHLAVVVDDAAQGVEEVVRGDDLAESACRQQLLYRLLDLAPRPRYVHVPLILAANGDRLAKRHGAVSLQDRLQRGETWAEVLGFLASTVGLGESGEPVTAAELLARFDRDRFRETLDRSPTLLPDDYLAECRLDPSPPPVENGR
ncbi:MAG: tRNA glutamyl-Q(34) synthetase GluQRS [Acidimicrobiia bacterium]|nr:tRNA glutamyl-Q(34) synthetase GluQRS [Acidimicrobiia bacterium]